MDNVDVNPLSREHSSLWDRPIRRSETLYFFRGFSGKQAWIAVPPSTSFSQKSQHLSTYSKMCKDATLSLWFTTYTEIISDGTGIPMLKHCSVPLSQLFFLSWKFWQAIIWSENTIIWSGKLRKIVLVLKINKTLVQGTVLNSECKRKFP